MTERELIANIRWLLRHRHTRPVRRDLRTFIYNLRLARLLNRPV